MFPNERGGHNDEVVEVVYNKLCLSLILICGGCSTPLSLLGVFYAPSSSLLFYPGAFAEHYSRFVQYHRSVYVSQ